VRCMPQHDTPTLSAPSLSPDSAARPHSDDGLQALAGVRDEAISQWYENLLGQPVSTRLSMRGGDNIGQYASHCSQRANDLLLTESAAPGEVLPSVGVTRGQLNMFAFRNRSTSASGSALTRLMSVVICEMPGPPSS
jgi:hypothetical protein